MARQDALPPPTPDPEAPHHLAAWGTFLRWLRQDGRYVGPDPLEGVQAPRHVDQRKPRALTGDELERILAAGLHRPLFEAKVIRRGQREGQLGAKVRPHTKQKLIRLGRERWLAYRLWLLTGLRASELAAVRVGDLDLDAEPPVLHLDASRTKNGEAACSPLRADLVEDLRGWVAEELERARRASRDRGEPVQAHLDPERALLKVPGLREFDKDCKFANVPKLVRKLTACRHSMRHSTATLLGAMGAPPQIISAWMRHAGDTLAERVYTDRTALDLLTWLDRLPAWRGDGEPQLNPDGEVVLATGTDPRVLTRVLTREPGEPCTTVRQSGSSEGLAADLESALKDPRDPHSSDLTLVGERGLEPPTRSTQSYASTN